MSRRKAAPKRVILADPLFQSKLLSRFINVTMRSGKKSLAESIVYKALDEALLKAKRPNAIPFDKTEKDDEVGAGGLASLLPKVKGSINECEHARSAALKLFEKALDKVMPNVEVKSRRVGGSTYQVPVEVRSTRRIALGMRWLIEYSCKRGEKTMVQRLSAELLDALNGRGGAFKKMEDVHRMAKANQAFSHYRW